MVVFAVQTWTMRPVGKAENGANLWDIDYYAWNAERRFDNPEYAMAYFRAHDARTRFHKAVAGGWKMDGLGYLVTVEKVKNGRTIDMLDFDEYTSDDYAKEQGCTRYAPSTSC